MLQEEECVGGVKCTADTCTTSSDLMLEEPTVPTFEEWDELLFSSSAVSSANGDNTKDFNPGSLTLSEVNNTYQFQDHLQEYEEHCHLTPV